MNSHPWPVPGLLLLASSGETWIGSGASMGCNSQSVSLAASPRPRCCCTVCLH